MKNLKRSLYFLTVIISIVLWYLLTLSYAQFPAEHWFEFKFIVFMNESMNGDLLKKYGLYSFLTIASIPLAFLILRLKPDSYKRFGDARFATTKEVSKYGYNAKKGIILGQSKWTNKLLISHGPKTVGLSAKPRSGKGVSLVIPNLLTWDGSVVCLSLIHI